MSHIYNFFESSTIEDDYDEVNEFNEDYKDNDICDMMSIDNDNCYSNFNSDCKDNDLIDVLKNIKNLTINGSVAFDTIPKFVLDYTSIVNMKLFNVGLISISNLPPNLIRLDLTGNNITNIDKVFPKSLTSINLSYNNISTVDCSVFPSNLIELNLSNNNIKNFSRCNSLAIQKLNISENRLNEIPMLSYFLRYLDISGNKINKISNLNHLSNLKTLICCNTNINFISHATLPDNIRYIDFHNCKIKYFNVPDSVATLYLGNNKINSIKKLSKNLTILDISGNEVNNITNDMPIKIEKIFINKLLLNNYVFNIINSWTCIIYNLDGILDLTSDFDVRIKKSAPKIVTIEEEDVVIL